MKTVTIVIPTYNEEDNILKIQKQLKRLEGNFDVIFTDGYSADKTYEKISYPKIQKTKHRANQMNIAAEEINSDYIWFVHADSIISKKSINAILNSKARYGCFSLHFIPTNLRFKNFLMKLVGISSNLRVIFRHITFGDQGIFIQTKLFKEIGGYSPIPIMEDYDLSIRLKKLGIYPKLLKTKIYTSPRRFYKNGIIKTIIKMQRLQHLFRNGKDINYIYEQYK